MKSLGMFSASVLLFAILAAGENASALSAGGLKNIKVVGHHFTTSVNNGKRIATAKSPSEARYLVVKLSVEVPSDDMKVFTNDFALQYFHRDGKEDRTKCDAICRASTAELGEDDGCAMGNAAWVLLDRASKFLTLVFYLENDVSSVSIARLGADPVTYQVGSDRPFSVYLTTNQGGEMLSRTEKVVRAGGYQVTRTSTKLSDETEGTTIHYADGAEVQAREISQRIMTVLGIVPVVKKMNLISENDIVIWLGK
jgi:hypothetical protein